MSEFTIDADKLPAEVEELENPVVVEQDDLRSLQALAETADRLETLHDLLEDH